MKSRFVKTIEVSGITIRQAQGRNPVYCKYQGQLYAQEAYIVMCPEEDRMYPDFNGEIGGAVSSMIWHGREFTVSVPSKATCKKLNTVMKRLAPLARIVFDMYDEHWNGSNWIGTYSDGDEVERLRRKMDEIVREEFEL